MTTTLHAKIAAVGFFLAIAATLGTAVASADPVLPQAGSEPADATIADLQSAGFDVRVNYGSGSVNVPLSECKVTDVDNPNGAMASMTTLSIVYVTISCANAK